MTDYFDVPALSASGINQYLDDGPHYYWPHSPFNPNRIKRTEQTEDMIFGSACHKLLLEPDKFHEDFAVIPNLNKRTNAGKEALVEFSDANIGKMLLEQETYDRVVACVNAVRANPDLKDLLKDAECEKEFYWVRNGLPCKAKIDIIKGVILDYKVMRSAKELDFRGAVIERGYHRQEYWYRDGFYRCTGEKLRFGFIVQDKNNPHAIGLFELDDIHQRAGQTESERAANEILERLLNERWTWFQKLSVPEWYANKVIREIGA